LTPSEWSCLAIEVTKSSLDRALRLFDAVIKAARERGWTVEAQSEGPFQTQVTVLEEAVAICLTEKVRQVESPKQSKVDAVRYVPYEHYHYEPTGQLTIRLATGDSFAWGTRTWNDGKVQRLETCLHDVMIGLVEVAEVKKVARRESEERQRLWAEEERQRQVAAERREREKDRREELQRQVDAWSRARELRAYLVALRTAARPHVTDEPDGRLARWVRWAETYAARLDPLRAVASLPLDPSGWNRTPIDLADFGIEPSPE
jgi:hypothetical protein